MFLILVIFILIVVGLTWFLLSRDRGSQEPVGALWGAAGFGVVALITAAFLEAKLLPTDQLLTHKDLLLLVPSMLGIGIIEELAKFVPLAAFIYKKRYFNEHTDGIIYFALSGLAFGLIENIMYTISYGSGTGVVRIFLVPFFHAATTGIVGYYLARAKVEGKPWTTCIPPLIIVAVLHGVYDFGLFSGVVVFAMVSLALTAMFSIGLFKYYGLANQLDKAMGLSTVGVNKFCRACGRPNPRGTLYCEYCGKQT